MKIVVFSDSHSNSEPMIAAAKAENPAKVIFLGDGLGDASELENAFPGLDIIKIKGNRDIFRPGHDVYCDTIDGVKIYATHGHIQRVKDTTEHLLSSAKAAGAVLSLFGHTHREVIIEKDKITLLNPGSIGFNHTYGVITTNNGKFECFLKRL
ncbi:MAG: metallophosphoesterase family protein [Eubacteriales bacterium]|jgi:putative phosphoesterase